MYADEKRHGESQTQIERWRQYLLDAAAQIERYGWAQHTLEADDGRLCMKGALNRVLTGDPRLIYLGDDGQKFHAELVLCMIRPASFNDKPGRTKAEVIAKLRELATP